MSSFFVNSPWWWWGVYIGGTNMACANTNVTASWIHDEVTSGWGIEPIWVGPQAPCVNQSGLSHLSTSTSTAFSQGESAAINAYDRIVALGMNTNTPIAYDMEAFDTTNSSCLAAVKSFMEGWDAQLAVSPPQKPGYYGSSCASDPTAMWSISPAPYYIWGADYGTGSDVYTMGCVSTSIWPRRLKQYTGGSSVTENGVTLNVDKDCAYGPVYGSGETVISGTCT